MVGDGCSHINASSWCQTMVITFTFVHWYMSTSDHTYLHIKSLETVLLVDSPHNIWRKPRETECYTLFNITSVGTLCKLCQSSEGNYSVLQQERGAKHPIKLSNGIPRCRCSHTWEDQYPPLPLLILTSHWARQTVYCVSPPSNKASRA